MWRIDSSSPHLDEEEPIMRHFRLPELLRPTTVTRSTPATINPVVIPYTVGLVLFLLAIYPLAGATKHRIHAGQGSSVIQRVINEASPGDTVSFDAGTYTVASPLRLKCGLTITGPVVPNFTTPTAEITMTTANSSIFNMRGGCNTAGTVEYLNFNNGGPIYFDTAGYSNFNFLHNAVTSLPYTKECDAGTCTAESLFFDGNVENIDSNITIEYNTFGDDNSCTAGLHIDSGACSGINFFLVGNISDLSIKYNIFHHLQEGMHFGQVGWAPRETVSVCIACNIAYNYFYDIVRITLENQASAQTTPTNMSYNVFGNPYRSITYSSMGLSAPCCISGATTNTVPNINPNVYIQSNVMFNNISPVSQTPIGIETAGNAYDSNNLIQGNFCNGFAYGETLTQIHMLDNTMQGYYMSSGAHCIFGAGGFYDNESGDPKTPVTILRNVTGATPISVTSVAPTISPASGKQSFPLKVTFTDPGYTAGPLPLGNTGIWYTTDGSTPVPGSGTAQYLASGGSFVLAVPATVKAVGMWGVPPQPTSYPAGYGFVPSTVKSVQYTSSAANQ
jgi:hypothetical protein